MMSFLIALVNKYVTAYRVVVLIAILILVIGTPFSIYFIKSDQIIPDAVTAYEFPLIETNQKPLCSGEKVVYDQSSHVDNAPVVLEVVESVWSVDQNKTALPDTHPFKVNIPPGFVGAHSHVEWIVPELPAGHYKLLRSTTAQGRKSEMYAVTFEVAKDCTK